MSEHIRPDESLDTVESSDDLKKIETNLVKKELEDIDPTIFQDVSPQARDRIVDTVGVFVSTTLHEGPLPSVKTLEGYDKLIPDGAHRIMAMAERQQEHRMAMENKVVQAEISQSFLGQWLAFAIGLSTLTTCGFCAYIGESILAGVIGAGGLVGLVSVFIQGKKQQAKDLENRQPPEPECRKTSPPTPDQPSKKKKTGSRK